MTAAVIPFPPRSRPLGGAAHESALETAVRESVRSLCVGDFGAAGAAIARTADLLEQAHERQSALSPPAELGLAALVALAQARDDLERERAP